MAHTPFSYELSPEADNDFSEIYDYTVEQFGSSQAVKYLNGFEELFVKLCSNPEIGRKRNEIRKGLRSISKESHIVFYRIMEGRIRIVRVLHASRDIVKFLPPKD
jgi:toxin ParE1/3/4